MHFLSAPSQSSYCPLHRPSHFFVRVLLFLFAFGVEMLTRATVEPNACTDPPLSRTPPPPLPSLSLPPRGGGVRPTNWGAASLLLRLQDHRPPFNEGIVSDSMGGVWGYGCSSAAFLLPAAFLASFPCDPFKKGPALPPRPSRRGMAWPHPHPPPRPLPSPPPSLSPSRTSPPLCPPLVCPPTLAAALP